MLNNWKPDPAVIRPVVRCSAYILFIWFACDLGMGFYERGFSNNNFLWISNLVVLGTAMALWIRHRAFLLFIFALYLVGTAPWLIDNLFRPLTGINVIGVGENLYRPGIPLAEFWLGHSQWFVLPALLLGARDFEDKPLKPVFSFLLLFFIFAASYLYGPDPNLNCIHSACIPVLSTVQGPVYTGTFFLLFFATVFGLSVALRKASFLRSHRVLPVTGGWTIFAVLFLLFDTFYFLKLPRFSIAPVFESEMVQARGLYTLDHADRWFAYNYGLRNKTKGPIECTSYLDVGNGKEPLQRSLVIRPNMETEFEILLPYPTSDTLAVLTADCTPY